MDKKYYPQIFDTYDYANEYLCIAPHSPCPVLYGIRGESPDILEEAQKMIRSERIETEQIFLTNQGTDMHLVRKRIGEIREYDSVIAGGRISQPPRTIKGGHVIFTVTDGAEIFCAAYEPTKEFRTVVRKLIVGDRVEVYGGVKYTKGLTVNLEKLAVLECASQYRVKKEKCSCGGTFKARGGGIYRCRKCGKKVTFEKVEVKRELKEGIYEVPPVARRHLAKPLCRY
jgi:tRNA(Ile2)-agmatinylcytidine synthase